MREKERERKEKERGGKGDGEQCNDASKGAMDGMTRKLSRVEQNIVNGQTEKIR